MLSEIEEEVRKEMLRLMKHFQCPICLNLMTDPMMTRCVHRFCGICINKAIESSSGDCCRCPLCNEKITKRSLRSQTYVSEIIIAFKEAVDLFEKDNQRSSITNAEEVVVFDVSTDRSKSCLQFNDTINEVIDDSIKTTVDDKSVDTIDVSFDVNTPIESNHKTTTVTVATNDWPSCETSVDVIEDKNNETEVYFDSSKTSINGTVDESCLRRRNGDLKRTYDNKSRVLEANPTQSQNLRVNKSKITYSSRIPTNDRFDQIIRLSDFKINDKNDGKQDFKTISKLSSESEIESLGSGHEVHRRKPLIQLKDKNNKNFDQKKKLKKVEELVSSEDDCSSLDVLRHKRKIFKSKNKTKNVISDDSEMSDEDLLIPALNKSFESKRDNDWVRTESRNGYDSETLLITSSPFD